MKRKHNGSVVRSLYGRRPYSRQGFFVPIAIAALLLLGIYVGTLMFASKSELHMLGKRLKQERARIIAESAIELSRALIFQNDFTRRWYKQKEFGKSRLGYHGVLEGKLNGGTFKVVGEDISDDTKSVNASLGSGGSDKDKFGWIANICYKRIDLFAEGRFDDARVIVHKRLFWYPPQKVFEWDVVESVDPTTGTTRSMWTNFRQR